MTSLKKWCEENSREDILAEWDYDKNELTPSDYSQGSNKSVFWKCSKGHTWEACVYYRKSFGCPYCSNRKAWKGFNDLATTYPDIAKEWDYEKNGELKPDNVTSGCGTRVWWLCPKGHSFATSISNRTSQHTGCAVCSGKRMLKGYNDLKTLNPSFLTEWDYEKNTDISPDEVTLFSHKRVWWKCKNCGNSWQAPVASRGSNCGCPKCSKKVAQSKRYETLLEEGTSLSQSHPELLEEWDYEKNSKLGLYPDKLLARSNRAAWWICRKCNNHWKAIINNRSKGVGCSICGRITAKEKMINTLIEERGSLAESESPLLLEWDYEKNKDITPYDVMLGSNTKVWWRCNDCGHSWQAPVTGRKKNGCPKCAKESRTSYPEQAIYYYISKLCSDAVNSYKEYGYELDIYIPSKKIAIEYDGSAWHKNIEKDQIKNSKCERDGVFLYRIREDKCPSMPNSDYLFCYKHENSSDLESLNRIVRDLCYRISGENIDININRDNLDILNLYVQRKKQNSLEVQFPDLAKQWDYSKNNGITPSMIMPNSSRKFWWVCEKGHSFETTANNRVNGRKGCPYCSNKRVLEGYNDLQTVNPEIAHEWHPTKNADLKPADFTAGSGKNVWWICDKGHEWQAPIHTRVGQGHGCPFCSGRFAIKGENDLTVTDPELSKEWNYSKNSDSPSDYKAGSNVKVWWKCQNGHEWQAQINSRSRGNGCPFCSGRRVLIGFNDLASQEPIIASEWCYEKNGNLMPEDFSCGSSKKVWWRCSACGNDWESTIGDRVKNGHGCPICSTRKTE